MSIRTSVRSASIARQLRAVQFAPEGFGSGSGFSPMLDSNSQPAPLPSVAATTPKGASYLQIGSMCMGIAGSSVSPDFLEDYLGMRFESVDEVEVLRRIEKGIYDKAEYEKCIKWMRKNLKGEAFDRAALSVMVAAYAGIVRRV